MSTLPFEVRREIRRNGKMSSCRRRADELTEYEVKQKLLCELQWRLSPGTECHIHLSDPETSFGGGGG